MATIVRGSKNSVGRDARKALQIEGIDEILENVSTVVRALGGGERKTGFSEAKKVYVDAAAKLAVDIRGRAPVRTGLLRSAVFSGPGDPNKSNALVGVGYGKAPHAHLVEYGTGKMSARPFVRPAVIAMGPALASDIKSGLLKVIAKHTK